MNFLRHNLKESNKGIGFTLAATYNEETARMNFGVAKCCKHDTFVKKVGRKMASERINQPTFSLPVPPESDLREIFNNEFDALKSDLKRMNIKQLKQSKTPKQSITINEPSFELVMQ